METRSLNLSTARMPGAVRDSKAPLRIAVAYQDTASLLKAIQFCDRIVHQHWEDIDIECSWWKLGFLRHPQVFRDAVEAGTDADMILVSVPAGHELAETTQDWIEHWLERRRFQTGALVSLVPEDPGNAASTSRIDGYLRQVAERGALDFFSHRLTTLDRNDRPLEDQHFSSAIIESLPEDDTTPRWGINE